jgi:uncharacterized protein YdaU (DUF1376 family)
MALRDQPYLPLYVQDFMTDEKLAECSAEATGVYIRLMCLMHKSEQYGCVLLKQKDKQASEQVSNFAYKVAKHLPYPLPVIERSIKELVEEGVLTVDGDCLFQKRMVKDCEISNKRALAGKRGGKKTQEFASKFAQAKTQANTENEYVIENEYVSIQGGKGGFQKPTIEEVSDYCRERGNKVDPQQWLDHYIANGWKVGRNPMKDWKATVRNWEKNRMGFTSPPLQATEATQKHRVL